MPFRNPIIRVVAISQDGLQRKDRKELFDQTMLRLEQASCRNPDIVCLPEIFPANDPESVPGPITEHLAQWAKEHNCYAICPLKVKDGELIYNSAVVIDRTGKIIGRYDKIHITEGGLKGGTTPGLETDPAVFETDFGTIGIQICFDVNWPKIWERLKEKGADIVFWPSAYPALRQLATHAWTNEYYVVSSTMGSVSAIFDISGDIIDRSGKYCQWAEAVLPMSKRLFEVDYHIKKMREVEQKYGSRIELKWHHEEGWFTLASLVPDLTVEDIMEEFGLVPLKPYITRCEKNIEETRKKLRGK